MTGPMPVFDPSSDAINEYFGALLAHRLPAVQSSATPLNKAHTLDAMVSSAPAPQLAHVLAAMQSQAPASRPMRSAPSIPMPPMGRLLADNSGPQSAIASLLQQLTQPPAGMAAPGPNAASGSPAPALPGPSITPSGMTMPAP